MTTGADMPPAVELRGLAKRFGVVQANSDVSLKIRQGTIHSLIGENGAGKSTAMKMLYGIYRPDAGEILVRGERCIWNSPADAIAKGIGMVHQHFMLAGPYNALDNILAGAEPRRWGMIDRRSALDRLEGLARQYGLAMDWERPVEELPVGMQQRVEILKLLHREADILILDEPTAVLVPQEIRSLFDNLRKLRDQGKTILLVTHKLGEVMALAERVTVFRAGKVVGSARASETSPQELADLMVGRKVSLRIDVPPARARGEPVLEVEDLNLRGVLGGSRRRLADVSFSVGHGEVVGVAGVEGNGQSEMLQAIQNPRDARCRTSGSVRYFGRDATRLEARAIRALGVAVIPEDRQREGLLLERPVRENFLLGLHRAPAFCRAGFVDGKNLEQAAMSALREYDVRPADLNAPAGKLSGGNQQKLIAAREFQRQPRLLIAAQPTRGVDVGAIEFIHGRIIQSRDNGAGVLLVSSELEEILALSDRILVMYEGRVTAEFARGQVTESELGLKMGGG